MPEIPYEKGAHYIFDRGYNDFGNLYTINHIKAFFVVIFKPEMWNRRLPENIVSDAVGYFTIYKSAKDYPEKLRKVVCIAPEDGTRYMFMTNNLTEPAETISELCRNRWSVERTVLQMDQAASAYQEVLENIRECSTNPNLLCFNYLLPYNNSATQYETEANHL